MHSFFESLFTPTHSPTLRGTWFGFWAVVSFTLLVPKTANGQVGMLGGVEPGGQYPSGQHYLALEVYRSGDLTAAAELFEAALRGSRRDINGRWLDAIPSLAMLGECYWHLGNVPAAKENVDHAFQIAIRNRGWFERAEWRSALQTGVVRARPNNLWPEAAAVNVLPVSDRIQFGSGQPLTAQALVQGGVIEEPNIRSMDIVEIMRGLAIASYRRRVLLGPIAENDPLAVGLLEATKFPADLQIPIARSLIGSLRTCGYFSELNDKRTLEEGLRSATLGGGTHPLSAIAMLCQTSTLVASGQSEQVLKVAADVANAAAAMDQPEWVGEAMQLAAGSATEVSAKQVARMSTVAATAMQRESRLASLHCLIAGADASITANDLDTASALMAQAQVLTSRRDVFQPRLQAYGSFVMARLAAARGASVGIRQNTELDNAIAKIQAFALNHRDRRRSLVSMPRIYQLGLIRQAVGTSLGANTSDKLLKAYCDEPPVDVWRRDPVDALAAVMIDRSVAHAARINLAASQGYSEPLLQASDAMLASRFLQRLPLGGRIAHVRAIARGDDQLLDPSVVEFRKQAGRTMGELRDGALKVADLDVREVELLEAKACALALSRTTLPQIALPLLDDKEPIAKLPKRTGLLTFTSVGNKLYATLAADGKVVMWAVAGVNRLPLDVGRLLKGIGVGKSRGKRLPEDDSWKAIAVAIRRQLFPDSNAFAADRFDELIIVPDGSLWYLPFEILPIGDENSPLMFEQISIRYAATPGLAMKPVAMPPTKGTVGIAADQFFAPRDKELDEAVAQSIFDILTDPVRLPGTVESPSGLLGNRVGHLVVAAARPINSKNQLLMSVASYDQASTYGTLAGWMRFPAEVPRSVSIFGLRTPIGLGQMGTGDEIFTTLCALNAAGVRSVLLSRWAVGGESSAILLREFLQELPLIGMNTAWSRARMLLMRTELDPMAEPLLTKAEHERDGLTGAEPLFWAGYLLSSPPEPNP